MIHIINELVYLYTFSSFLISNEERLSTIEVPKAFWNVGNFFPCCGFVSNLNKLEIMIENVIIDQGNVAI